MATPMCYALSFLFLFSIGGLTGLFLGALSTDIHLHDTYFVVAHFHYVMMGGTLVAFLGGVFYWWPKMTGKMYNERIGQISALLVFIGFNATFFPQFVMGTRGMPRRYYNYVPEFQFGHVLSTMGAYLLGIGLSVAAYALIMSLVNGKKAAKNPWGAATLEWETATPPIHHNFEETPVAGEPYALEQMKYDEQSGEYVRTGSPAPAHA